MPQADSLVLWILYGCTAFFVVGFSWGTLGLIELLKSKKSKTSLHHGYRSGISEKQNLALNEVLISKFEMIDHLHASASGEANPEIARQVGVLRDEYLKMLEEFSLKKIEYGNGVNLSVEDRKRTMLLENAGKTNTVIETVSCGFEFSPEEGEPELVRKAVVRLG